MNANKTEMSTMQIVLTTFRGLNSIRSMILKLPFSKGQLGADMESLQYGKRNYNRSVDYPIEKEIP